MIKSLNENIKSFRMLTGMNQIEMGNKLNVSKQCVSNWENDNVQPSVEMLVRIADLFGVSTDQLLGRSSKRTIDASGISDEQYAHIRLLVKDFETLNSKCR